jgi:hypothetical protein
MYGGARGPGVAAPEAAAAAGPAAGGGACADGAPLLGRRQSGAQPAEGRCKQQPQGEQHEQWHEDHHQQPRRQRATPRRSSGSGPLRPEASMPLLMGGGDDAGRLLLDRALLTEGSIGVDGELLLLDGPDAAQPGPAAQQPHWQHAGGQWAAACVAGQGPEPGLGQHDGGADAEPAVLAHLWEELESVRQAMEQEGEHDCHDRREEPQPVQERRQQQCHQQQQQQQQQQQREQQQQQREQQQTQTQQQQQQTQRQQQQQPASQHQVPCRHTTQQQQGGGDPAQVGRAMRAVVEVGSRRAV